MRKTREYIWNTFRNVETVVDITSCGGVWSTFGTASAMPWFRKLGLMVAPRGAGGCHLNVSCKIASTYGKDDLSSNSGNLSVPTMASISAWARFQMRGFLTIASVNVIIDELVCARRKYHVRLLGCTTDRLYRTCDRTIS